MPAENEILQAPDHETLGAMLQKQYELGLVTLKLDDPRVTAQLLHYCGDPLPQPLPDHRLPGAFAGG